MKPIWRKSAISISFIFLIYLYAMNWEVNNTRAWCEDIQPGGDMFRLVPKWGFDSGFAKDKGRYDQATGQWKRFVSADMTFGVYGCEITHNSFVAISAKTINRLIPVK